MEVIFASLQIACLKLFNSEVWLSLLSFYGCIALVHVTVVVGSDSNMAFFGPEARKRALSCHSREGQRPLVRAMADERGGAAVAPPAQAGVTSPQSSGEGTKSTKGAHFERSPFRLVNTCWSKGVVALFSDGTAPFSC
jgi:hypothetical protein